MTIHQITFDGATFYEDTYRLTTRDLFAAGRYLVEVLSDLQQATVDPKQITVRAELDAAPYSVEIEVYLTEAQATTLGWSLDEAKRRA